MTFNFKFIERILLDILASLIFYTSIPLPYIKALDFQGVARFAPFTGLIIGIILALLDMAMNYLGVPVLTRSTLVVGAWVMITGGLHLDGVMDTADGLAVLDPQRRLEVMTDSATGAFGAMSAVVLLLLKTAALTDIQNGRWLILMLACAWGRWGQVSAIARYAYLKPSGKGAFHKQAIQSYKDVLPTLVLILSIGCLSLLLHPHNIYYPFFISLAGGAIATLTGAWFNYKLGGHTGDTYGAVVEWTEAFFLCVMTVTF